MQPGPARSLHPPTGEPQPGEPEGLDEAEAARRLSHHGPNIIAPPAARGMFEIAGDALREPMFFILLLAAALYLVVGDIGEGLFLLGGATISIGLVVFQEMRSERALLALRELAEPMAWVIRGGQRARVPARTLVPGDLVLVAAGERLPVDGRMLPGSVLTVDESSLTGEAASLDKIGRDNAGGADDMVPGVNDAPALVSAHIGIAMGMRGTAVAREASDIILLADSFASIVGGVRLGRRIFVNLRRALTYIVAIHVPTAGLALLPVLLGLPPILYPMHIVLLELMINPLSSLTFEGEPSERGAMERPPRPAAEPLFGRRDLLSGMAQGLVVLAAMFGLYWAARTSGRDPATARAMAFVALVTANLSLALSDASGLSGAFLARARPVFWAVAGAAAMILAAALALPSVAAILQMRAPSPAGTLLAVTVGLAAGCLPAARLHRAPVATR